MSSSQGNDPRPPRTSAELDRELKLRSRRAFATGGAAAIAAIAGWRWLATAPQIDGVAWPLRRVLEANERISKAVFGESRTTAVYPASAARMPRANGSIGIDPGISASTWRLRVIGPGGDRAVSLEEIQSLPLVEMTTRLCCIEGWSQVVAWAGARLSDLAALSGLATHSGRPPDPRERPLDLLTHVAIETPDGQYYIGLDMLAALHPQTLLCYQMQGKPLTIEHGAPLRLVIPFKYGIKSIKQIGTIRFQPQRPPDYWGERGYDWYAGL